MTYIYKPVKFREDKWDIVKKLADQLSEERGTQVSIPDAATEAVKRLLDEREAEKEESNE